MHVLPNELIVRIIKFSHNDTIDRLFETSKQFRNVLEDDIVDEALTYRRHPLTFNLIDNYCKKCNRGILILQENTRYYTCSHQK
jgi:hypothetical protein